MATQGPSGSTVTQDTLITIKITVNDTLKKLKLPLRDLGAQTLPDKLRHVLAVKPEQTAVFERFSDSAGGYIVLDPNSPQVFKTLIRAAKAKLKLRLKATISPLVKPEAKQPEMTQEKSTKLHAIDSILRQPINEKSNHNEPTAFDRRSNIGSGIFQFRESQAHTRASEQPVSSSSNDALAAPESSDAQKSNLNDLTSKASRLSLQSRVLPAPKETRSVIPWSVFCNECDKTMPDSHFHCSICDGGDYDLCEECVVSGKLCPGEGHWLLKRSFKDGKVVNSTTERISPRPKPTDQLQIKEQVARVPGEFTEDTESHTVSDVPTRTCNSCVVVLPEQSFVTCADCDDYDLCLSCHTKNKHGHHPAHRFKPATEATALGVVAETMLAPGRNIRHNALCDGCDKKIYGIRHKCLACPDWDYCNDCIGNAHISHPRHRFAPIYAPIPDAHPSTARHVGIFCDGLACSKVNATYITGVRYKCAVCNDTDFCASCEASPSNHHNRTHPLIKFKTPVRNVSITTENEDISGKVRTMGDRPKSEVVETRTQTAPIKPTNAATQVQTVAEIKPTEMGEVVAQPLPVVKTISAIPCLPTASDVRVPASHLNAHFVQDSVTDGCMVIAGSRFTQIWTVRNPGPYVWTPGCSVRYVGGDNMLNVDNVHPASVSNIADATESNVVGRQVQVGEEISFKVVLKAPLRLGKSISYWRLKAADGTPFGHRLWCDITVTPVSTAPMSIPHVGTDQQQQMMARMQMNVSQQASALRFQKLVEEQKMAQDQKMAQNMMAQLAQQEGAQFKMAHLARQQQQQLAQQQWTQAGSFTPPQQAQALQQAQMRQKMLAFQHQMAVGQAESPAQTQARMTARNAPPQVQPAIPAGQPPAYESTEALATRLNALRDEQAKRRTYMLARLNAHRDQAQAQAQAQGVQRADLPDLARPTNPTARPAEQMASLAASIDDNARKEAAKQKAEHIKAKIMKMRDQRANMFTDNTQAAPQASASAEALAEQAKKLIDKVNKDANVADNEEDLEGSRMVFPKLDKESPASSIYGSATSSANKAKAAYVESEAGVVEQSAAPAGPSTADAGPYVTSPLGEDDDFEDLTDDLEVLSADDHESDDGFLTDEEYDVLNASDEETIASP